MNNKSVSEALLSLANSSNRSDTARLRDVFDAVESALGAGVSRATVLAELQKQGLTMTPKSFEGAVYRIRKERRQADGLSAKRPASAVTVEPSQLVNKADDNNSSEIDIATLSPKEKRERLGDKYVKNESSHLLTQILGKKQ
jgi:hypothetical protein